MINTTRILKVAIAWTSIVYVVCFAVVALFPGVRDAFFIYSIHTKISGMENVMSAGTFISGLIIWNIIAVLAVWLFAALYNRIRT